MSRRDLIIDKYNLLLKKLEHTNLFNIDILPSLNDIDVVDLIFYFQLIFPNSEKYKESIDDVLESHSVVLKQYEKNVIYDIIVPFLELFRKIT
jgi:hypothetical protein